MTTIVVDNGTDMCKAGFVDDEAPKVVHPTIVGLPPKQKITLIGTNIGEPYTDFNPKPQGSTDLKKPIQNGIIVDWESMGQLWHQLFHDELKIQPYEHPILLSEAALNPKANKEKMVQMMFEDFNMPAVCIEKQPVLSLYGTGRTSGLVVDVGEGVNCVASVHDEYVLQPTVINGPISGGELTDHMSRVVNNCRHGGLRGAVEIARRIKEKLCYVAINYNDELNSCSSAASDEQKYTLPDGGEIQFSKTELFHCPELLFQPSLAASESLSIQEAVSTSIDRITDHKISGSFYKNIVLLGGSTMFPGFSERLHKEVSGLASIGTPVKIVAPPMCRYLTWLGGSIMGSLEDPRLWYTREEYEENGPSLVHRNYKRKGTSLEKKY